MAFTGFTAQTAKHLQLDAGAFLKDYDPTTDTWETAKATKLIGAIPMWRESDLRFLSRQRSRFFRT